jgi:hypothetical protein
MELFYTILGLAMFYAWIHSMVIIIKKVKETTSYEAGVLIAGAVAFGLYVIGTL